MKLVILRKTVGSSLTRGTLGIFLEEGCDTKRNPHQDLIQFYKKTFNGHNGNGYSKKHYASRKCWWTDKDRFVPIIFRAVKIQ